MHEFKTASAGVGSIQYVVLKCPACGRVQRFMHRQECFGKVPKNAGCKQCQKPIPLEENCLDHDPLPAGAGEDLYSLVNGAWVRVHAKKTEYAADFTTADKVK